MPPPPLTIDDKSGWTTAPAAARLAGAGEVFRFFGSAEDAINFLHQATRAAARQRRRRERLRKGVIVAPVPITGPVIDVLTHLNWIADRDTADRGKVGAAIGAMLADLAQA